MRTQSVCLAFVFILIRSIASAQWSQQGNKLVGTDAVGSANEGYSVSLSVDGNTVFVGAAWDNFSIGAAWVFTRSAGTWSQQGGKLLGTGAVGKPFQGRSVALSADGNTAIVGGSYDSITLGAAWVFTRSAGVWSQQGSKLVGTGAVNVPYGAVLQGTSVSLSADGNIAIVGGRDDNNGMGAVWVFTRSDGVWSQQGSKLVGSGAVGNATQGYSVALSADGNTAIVGGPNDDGGIGAVWVFTRGAGVWNQQGSKLVGTGAVGVASQGYSVALSADGSTAVVGGQSDNNLTGAAWVFTRSAGVWSQQGNKLVGTGAMGSANQGNSVSLSADGNTAIMGGSGDSNLTGAAWMFTRSAGVWTQHGNKLVGTGAAGSGYQGYSVALSADGNTAIVGGPGDNNGMGAVWVFTQPATQVGKDLANTPHKFLLEQNYPNPFNPVTKIQFTIVNRQPTIVKVYDVLGRDVATLVNEVRQPGTYTVEFDGSNLASGTYFYRLQAGDFIATKRLLLLK